MLWDGAEASRTAGSGAQKACASNADGGAPVSQGECYTGASSAAAVAMSYEPERHVVEQAEGHWQGQPEQQQQQQPVQGIQDSAIPTAGSQEQPALAQGGVSKCHLEPQAGCKHLSSCLHSILQPPLFVIMHRSEGTVRGPCHAAL